MGKVLRFTTTLLATDEGRAFIPIDEATREALGGGGRIPVRATFNGVEYRGSVCKMGGAFRLGLRNDIRDAARTAPGDELKVTLERDGAPRTVDIPDELEKAFKKSRAARETFERLSFSHRKEYVTWIGSAKKVETRATRAAKALEMLRAGTKTPG
jgi:hypothetical protein